MESKEKNETNKRHQKNGGKRDCIKEESAPKILKQVPLCLPQDFNAKGYLNYMRDCMDCTNDEHEKCLHVRL